MKYMCVLTVIIRVLLLVGRTNRQLYRLLIRSIGLGVSVNYSKHLEREHFLGLLKQGWKIDYCGRQQSAAAKQWQSVLDGTNHVRRCHDDR